MLLLISQWMLFLQLFSQQKKSSPLMKLMRTSTNDFKDPGPGLSLSCSSHFQKSCQFLKNCLPPSRQLDFWQTQSGRKVVDPHFTFWNLNLHLSPPPPFPYWWAFKTNKKQLVISRKVRFFSWCPKVWHFTSLEEIFFRGRGRLKE